MGINERIKKLREEKQISQYQLALALQLPRYILSNIEQGRTEPNLEYLVKLANYFGCTTDELLGREPAEPATNSIKITPLAKRLLEAFYQIQEVDQHKLVAMAEALATMS